MGFFSKLFAGLKKTKDALFSKISAIFHGELDDEFFEDLEYTLISSDISVEATEEIIASVRKSSKKQKVKTIEDFKKCLKEAMVEILNSIDDEEEETPCAYTIVGVNGVGKTTAIGKLAHLFKGEKKSVLLVAGDTFRAAAADQLTEWSKRAGVRIVKYSEGADPGAVVYDGLTSATAKRDDVVLIDTAGRLQNKSNLMEELRKINKVIDKTWQGSRRNYIVIDATTGQNALSQVEIFNEIIPLDGIILTKLDGTAKGGVVFSIVKNYGIPVKYIGVGEGIDDLQPFNAEDFINSIV